MRRLAGHISIDYISSELRSEKIMRYALILGTAIYAVACGIMHFFYSTELAIWFIIPLMPLGTFGIVYLFRLLPCLLTEKWLRKHALDIYDVAASGQAVISSHNFAVVPYSMIAWIYLAIPNGVEEPPYPHYLVIHCTDGKRFTVHNDAEIWYSKIVSAVPNVITGGEAAKRGQYLYQYPAVKAKRYRRWGIPMLLFALFLTVGCIVNRFISIEGIVFQTCLYLMGGWLLWHSFYRGIK